MGEVIKIGLLYLGLHNQLVKKYGVNTIITRKEFIIKVGRHYMIPKDMRHWIIKEMEDAKLIEKINRDSIKILGTKINIENDHHKLNKILNL